ncbi:MAG: ABC transporter ATP-binding protein [Opitutales bacterium]|nr:ABC transporter ATP-binding protein [Opitutales bacterium]
MAVVQLEGIHKVYGSGGNRVHALRGVDLKVERGEFVAIMGSSGSGKSTLMNLLGCLDRPTAGRYLLDGADVARMNADRQADLRNQKLGFVFQNFHLLSRTSALENVEMPMLYHPRIIPRKQLRKRAERALAQVGLAERADHHPNQLSGGQQQRVAIARALVNEPQILLADEPTGNLDTRTSLEIMTLFQELNDSGLTILIVTHEPDICDFTRRILTVKDGRISADKAVSKRMVARSQLEHFIKRAEAEAVEIPEPELPA